MTPRDYSHIMEFRREYHDYWMDKLADEDLFAMVSDTLWYSTFVVRIEVRAAFGPVIQCLQNFTTRLRK